MRLALCGGLGMRLALTKAVQRPGNEASADKSCAEAWE